MRKLASVQKIVDIRPIKGADFIVVAQVQGWECVVKKDEFQVGDLVVYIEVDSKVPETPHFEFLRDRKFRIKTIKLKKQVSQGLVLGLDILPNGKYKEGDDVTEILGVKKHDPQAEKEQRMLQEQLDRSNNRIAKYLSRYSWFRRLFFKPSKTKFPEFIAKTDETRIQNRHRIIDEEADTYFILTEKLDGQSGTYALVRRQVRKFFGLVKKEELEFIVCSRNLQLPKEDNSSYWTIARQLEIKKVLTELIGDEKFVVLQGEITGEGIQGNKYEVEGYDFHAFNLIYPNRKVNSVLAEDILEKHNIKFVPILKVGFQLLDSVQAMVEFAKGKSVVNPKTTREGLVIRNYDKDISVKVINPDWLLKYEE